MKTIFNLRTFTLCLHALLCLCRLGYGSVVTKEDLDNKTWYQTLYEKNSQLPPEIDYTIPPILHVIWLGPNPIPKETLLRLHRWHDRHPSWKMKFWTDTDAPPPLPWMELASVSAFSFHKLESCYMQSDNVGEKSELLRYEILYKEGGLYIDHDTEPLLCFEDVHHTYHFYAALDDSPPYVLSSNVMPSTAIIGSSAKHPVLEETMHWLYTHWNNLENQYPGTDSIALFNRIKHRTFSALEAGIKRGADLLPYHDIIFPAATLARHAHLGTWHATDALWSSRLGEQLEHIEKKSDRLFWLLGAMAVSSCLLFLFSKRKTLAIVLAIINTSLCAQETDQFMQWMGKESEHWQHVVKTEDIHFLQKCQKIYEKNIPLLTQTTSKETIPHIIHFIWLGPRPFPPESVENVRTWMAHHPDWEVKFWTDRDRDPPCKGMQKILVNSFAFSQLESAFKESENYGEQSDILRYEILFQEGGVYADHDANCLQSFENLHSAYDLYCCLEAPHPPFAKKSITCGNGVIGARAGHPCIKFVLDWIDDHWQFYSKIFRGRDGFSRNELVMHRTYIALTHAIEEHLNIENNQDIVLPSAYFFAKKGIPSLFSEHFYATTWGNTGPKRSIQEKNLEKHINKVAKRSSNLYVFAFGICVLQSIILWSLIRKKTNIR